MFNFSFDRRTTAIVIAILVGINLLTYLSNPSALFVLLVSIPGVLVAITFHEFAHGYAAYKLGDNTAKNEGRLSLNPLAHLDPIGSLMLLFAGFGWGKPVIVNPRNYTRKIPMEKGEAIVSAAGPIMNIVLAFVFTIIYYVIYKYAYSFTFTTVGSIVMLLISATISINIGLGIFNLIPLPPLDGGKILKPFLPNNAKQWFVNNEQIFYMIFIVLWITGLTGVIINPVIKVVEKAIYYLAGLIIL
ncbi:MAG: site-2 protease family protein [Clostridia bacterium]|nr:site-2 protease family protein [Clostridia bacterium]